jgi:hypothetical protein
MTHPVNRQEDQAVLEVATRKAVCVVPGCGGAVVRHSLGGGVAVDRCTRCFRRYEVRGSVTAQPRGGLKRLLEEFVSWQDR